MLRVASAKSFCCRLYCPGTCEAALLYHVGVLSTPQKGLLRPLLWLNMLHVS